MNIIPILPATLDIIEVLNGGVRPELESEETYFVYKGQEEPPSIITQAELEAIGDVWYTVVKILFLNRD
jgi:hypothetical protein